MKLVLGASLSIALGIASSSLASTITLDNASAGFGQTVQTNVTSATLHAGEINWTVTGMTGNAAQLTGFSVGETISTFCTQITQAATSPVTYDLVDLSSAPQPGESMGSIRSSLLSALYSEYHTDAFTSDTYAAAFQLAIWEIVHEDTNTISGGTFDVTAGAFQVTGGDVMHAQIGSGISAVSLANQWLGTLAHTGGATLMALSSKSGQDQIFVVVPLPPAVLIGGLGLLAIPLIRRRFMA